MLQWLFVTNVRLLSVICATSLLLCLPRVMLVPKACQETIWSFPGPFFAVMNNVNDLLTFTLADGS